MGFGGNFYAFFFYKNWFKFFLTVVKLPIMCESFFCTNSVLGKGANPCVMAARLGAKVSMVGKVIN